MEQDRRDKVLEPDVGLGVVWDEAEWPATAQARDRVACVFVLPVVKRWSMELVYRATL